MHRLSVRAVKSLKYLTPATLYLSLGFLCHFCRCINRLLAW
jgi:hypothetical protein